MIKTKRRQRIYVDIVYPQENEEITGPNYTIKIKTNSEGRAEISINACDWESCRESGGVWWYDWKNYTQGRHRILARISDDKGNILEISEIRKCVFK